MYLLSKFTTFSMCIRNLLILITQNPMLTMFVTTACGIQSAKQNTEETTNLKGEDTMNPNLAKQVTSEEEYYIFNLSDQVTRTHVYYKNRYGIELVVCGTI